MAEKETTPTITLWIDFALSTLIQLFALVMIYNDNRMTTKI